MKKTLLFITMIALGFGLNAQVVTFEDDFEGHTDGVNLVDVGYAVWAGEALVVDTDIQTGEEAANGGKNFAKCTPGGNDFYLRKSVTLEVGKTYTFDVHTRGTMNHKIAYKLGADAPTTSGLINSATWVRNTLTFTVTSSGQTDAIIWVYSYPINRVDVDDFRLYEGVAVGIEDLEQFGFGYYPNPAKDNLQLRSAKEIQNVAVFNLLGQEMLNLAKPGNSINVANLAKGVYIMEATIEGNTGSFKFIKE